MENTLLLVDDEENILNALMRLLRRSGYKVLTALGGEEGLRIMAAHDVHVVISDQRMPNMSGSEFLTRVNEKYPNTVRMVLSGYADLSAVTDAINHGHIYKFLVKPWDDQLLLSHIHEAFSRYEMGIKGAQFTQIYENTTEGIVITDASGIIQAVNPAFTQITGYTAGEVVGKSNAMLNSGQHAPPFFRTMWEELNTSGKWMGEIWNKRKNGEIYPEWLNISAIRDKKGNLQQFVGLFSDISEQKKAEEALRHQAYHDPLTDLPNRLLYAEHLELALSQAQRRNQMCAVVMLDLDHFKHVNDTYGHEFGDKLLIEVARRLRDCIRKGDTLARMGGDEFTILLPLVNALGDAQIVGEKILRLFQTPIVIDGTELFISPSLGIALYPNDGKEPDSLLKNADAAMYRAKDAGRNNYQFFTPEMNDRAQRRLLIENALRRAISAGQIEMHYQPKIGVKEGRVTGAEALIRWKHPEYGYISPAEFIPIAEEGGMILPIGEWLIGEVAHQIAHWRQAGLDVPRIAINLSGRQFQRQNLENLLVEAVEAAGIETRDLELEITEGTVMTNAEKNIETLVMLKRMGFSIAIDDFGTGYSSLSYLRRFTIDVLKVDYSFVREMVTDSSSAELVRGVIDMAHSLHLKTVAEGVETREQLAMLQQFGCDIIQGFLFSRALPAGEFAEFIAKQSSHPEVVNMRARPPASAHTPAETVSA